MIEQYLKGLKVPKDELTAIERNKEKKQTGSVVWLIQGRRLHRLLDVH